VVRHRYALFNNGRLKKVCLMDRGSECVLFMTPRIRRGGAWILTSVVVSTKTSLRLNGSIADKGLVLLIAPAIKTLKQLPRTLVRGMWIKQNKSGL